MFVYQEISSVDRMPENDVFYSETMSIVEIVIEASVEVICSGKRKPNNKVLLGDNWKVRLVHLVH